MLPDPKFKLIFLEAIEKLSSSFELLVKLSGSLEPPLTRPLESDENHQETSKFLRHFLKRGFHKSSQRGTEWNNKNRDSG